MRSCSSCEWRAECELWYMSEISELRPSRSVSSPASTRCPACAPAPRGSRPAAGCGWHVVARYRVALLLQVDAQRLIWASVTLAQSWRTIAASSMTRTWNTWRASSMLGVATKAPRAGSSLIRWSRESWLSAWRTMVPRDLEDVGDLLLGQLGARHQATLDDRLGDRRDDALRGTGLRLLGCPGRERLPAPVPRHPGRERLASFGSWNGFPV